MWILTELRIATRRSTLAVAQASRVADLVRQAHPDIVVSLVEVDTSGDRDRVGPIAELTEVGAFVRSVQEAVLEGRADVAVHSLKDLPVTGPVELEVAAFPERASPFDALVGSSLEDMAPDSLVGTGSPRRVAQLLALRPDLRTTELRGNVDTRLKKIEVGEVDGAVLAEAGLERLGKQDLISQRFEVNQMVPAPGQGALAVEARRGSLATELCKAIDDELLRSLLSAERDLMAKTGAGCRSALGALATWVGDMIRFDVFVSDARGPRRTVVTGGSPQMVVAAAQKELGV